MGAFLKYVFPLTRKSVEYIPFVTGIPIIRSYFFLVPYIMTIFTVYKLFHNYKAVPVYRESYSRWKFIKKFYMGRIATHTFLMAYFYIMYWYLYLPLWNNREYRLSGHTLAVVFSGLILVNLFEISQKLTSIRLDSKFAYTLRTMSIAMLYHNAYCLMWTVWIYHRVSECIISFVLAGVAAVVIEFAGLDRYMIVAISGELPKEKQSNKLI